VYQNDANILEVCYDNALYKFTFDIDIDIGITKFSLLDITVL